MSDETGVNQHASLQRIEGTIRIEAFSDGVMAIIITLLIFEVHVPALVYMDAALVLLAVIPFLFVVPRIVRENS